MQDNQRARVEASLGEETADENSRLVDGEDEDRSYNSTSGSGSTPDSGADSTADKRQHLDDTTT